MSLGAGLCIAAQFVLKTPRWLLVWSFIPATHQQMFMSQETAGSDLSESLSTSRRKHSAPASRLGLWLPEAHVSFARLVSWVMVSFNTPVPTVTIQKGHKPCARILKPEPLTSALAETLKPLTPSDPKTPTTTLTLQLPPQCNICQREAVANEEGAQAEVVVQGDAQRLQSSAGHHCAALIHPRVYLLREGGGGAGREGRHGE